MLVLALTAWTLLRDPQPVAPVEVASAPARAPHAFASNPPNLLPKELVPLTVEEAQRDIFARRAASAPAPVASKPPPPPWVEASPVLVPAAMPLPTAPPMVWRFLGRMQTPEGRVLVLLSRPDRETPVTADQGTSLGDGYVVKEVAQEAVRLTHPPTGTDVEIPISAPRP